MNNVDQNTRTIVAVLVALLTGFYQLPGAIAIHRGHKDTVAINLWNFFTGWTVIGWIVTLVWSLGNVPQATPAAPPIAGWYADPQGAADERYWNGASWMEKTRNLEE